MKINTYFKQQTPRNPAYLDYIRSKACVCCGSRQYVCPHHESLNGRGCALKASDMETLPMCHACHTERHTTGRETFYDKYDIDYVEEIENLQQKYGRRDG